MHKIRDIYGEVLRSLLTEADTWSEFEGTKNTVPYKDFPYGLKSWLKNLQAEYNVPTPVEMEVIDTEGNPVNYGETVGSLKKEFSQYFTLIPFGNKVDVKPEGQLVHRKESSYQHSTASGQTAVPPGKVLVVCTWFMTTGSRKSVKVIVYINSTDKVSQLKGKGFSGYLGKSDTVSKSAGSPTISTNKNLPVAYKDSEQEEDYKKLEAEEGMTKEQISNLKDLMSLLKSKNLKLYNDITYNDELFNYNMFKKVFNNSTSSLTSSQFPDDYLSSHQYDTNIADSLIKAATEREKTGSAENPERKIPRRTISLFPGMRKKSAEKDERSLENK